MFFHCWNIERIQFSGYICPLEMETCSMRQKYMLSTCLYFWATPFVLPSTLPFSWHCHRMKPKGLQLKLSLLAISHSHALFYLLRALISSCLSFQKHPVCFQTSLSSAWSASAFPLWPRIHILLSGASWVLLVCPLSFSVLRPAVP